MSQLPNQQDSAHLPSRPTDFNPNLLADDLRRLPPALHRMAVYLLKTGHDTDFVTRFIMAQGYRGGLQNLSEDELRLRVECLRLRLQPRPSSVSSERTASLANAGTSSICSSEQTKGDAVRRAVLLWELAHVSAPLLEQFLRQLTEGGEVEQRVLRKVTNSKTVTSGDATNNGTNNNKDSELTAEARPPARTRGRGKRKKRKRGFRAQKGDAMLKSLSRLPLPTLQEAIFLLQNQIPALMVARYLVLRNDLGGCAVVESSLRQYLQFLASLVKTERKPSAGRKRLLHQIASDIQRQQVRLEMVALARRSAATGKEDPRAKLSVPQAEPVAFIKKELTNLFYEEPQQLLARIMAYRLGKDVLE